MLLPPSDLDADAVVLHRYVGAETERLLAAVRESIEHLRPWMPWAAEEPTYDALDEFVARSAAQWASGDAYNYWLSDGTSSDVIGSAGLHRRVGEHALEIGYWVHARWTNRGVASAAAAALTTAGLGLRGIERIEIHCDEANLASAAVPVRLGYRLERVVDEPPVAPGEIGRRMVWATDATSWTPAP